VSFLSPYDDDHDDDDVEQRVEGIEKKKNLHGG
jgi:hypothetical protein